MNQSLPSLNTLKAFEAAARHLNYHAAAEELNVTPAAVKQLVSRLEAAVGTPLLTRKGRGLILTQAGMAGLDDLSQGMQHIRTSVEKMRDTRQRRQLIITVEPSFSSAWLVPRLAQFRQAHPDISVLIDSCPQIIDLPRSNIDLAIRYGIPRDDGLVRHPLFSDIILPACSPAYAAGLPFPPVLSDLQASELIHWDTTQLEGAKSSQQWFLWKGWLANFGIQHIATDEGMHFSEYSQALQAAIAGQGVILVSEPIVSNLFQSGLLTCPFDEKASPALSYDVVATEESARRPEALAFIDWITATAHAER